LFIYPDPRKKNGNLFRLILFRELGLQFRQFLIDYIHYFLTRRGIDVKILKIFKIFKILFPQKEASMSRG